MTDIFMFMSFASVRQRKERRPNDKGSEIACEIIRTTTPDRQQKSVALMPEPRMQEIGYGQMPKPEQH
jgi:hypothetical protein